MIERTSPRPSGKACSSSCRPMPFDWRPRTDEQLRQLEEAAALDRARVPDQLGAVGSLGNPPLGRVIGQESVDRLDPLPPRVGIALQRRPVPAAEVGGRDPQQVVAGADVGRGSATDDRGRTLGHPATIQATSRGRRGGAPPRSLHPLGSVYHPAVRHRASRLVGPQATESVAFGQLRCGGSSAWNVRQPAHSETHASPADRCRNGGRGDRPDLG